jgi:hypothetical protein
MTLNKNSDGVWEPWGHGGARSLEISKNQDLYYTVRWMDNENYPNIVQTSTFSDLPEACAWSTMLNYNNLVFISLEKHTK